MPVHYNQKWGVLPCCWCWTCPILTASHLLPSPSSLHQSQLQPRLLPLPCPPLLSWLLGQLLMLALLKLLSPGAGPLLQTGKEKQHHHNVFLVIPMRGVKNWIFNGLSTSQGQLWCKITHTIVHIYIESSRCTYMYSHKLKIQKHLHNNPEKIPAPQNKDGDVVIGSHSHTCIQEG